MTTIHAFGTSTRVLAAELATVRGRISVASPDRARSIAEATEQHNRVVERAKQLRDAGSATRFDAAPISTWAHRPGADGSGRPLPIEHQTSSTVDITLSALELVSALVLELAAIGVETSVTWSLTDATQAEVQREMRRAAVAESRAVAEDYAEALGERIARVLSLSDEAAARFPGPGPALRTMAAYAAVPEITIAEITVSASVSGVYETER